MKRIFILHMLLSIFLISNASEYRNVSQPRKLGYTTNYGYSFNVQQPAMNTYNASPNYNFKSVNPYSNRNSYGYGRQYQMYYMNNNTNYNDNNGHKGHIRKSAQRPYSGNFLEDLADWWRMTTDSDWPGYVDEDYWEEFLALYPEYEAEARAWFESQGMKFPTDPDDPFGDPIGNNILPLLLMSLTYFIYKRRKLKTVSI